MSLSIAAIKRAYRAVMSAFAGYKKSFITLTFLGFLGGLFEGIGVTALVPLLSFVIGTEREENFIADIIEKLFLFLGFEFSLQNLLIFIALLFVAKAIVLFLVAYTKAVISSNYEKNLRNRLLSRTLRAKWPFLIEQKLGHLDTLLMIDVHYTARALQILANTTVNIASLATYLVIALTISTSITLLTLLMGTLVVLMLSPVMKRIYATAHEISGTNKKVAHHVNQHILGVKTIKAAHVEESVVKRGDVLFENLRKLRVRVATIHGGTESVIEPIGIIFVSVIFAISFKALDFNFALFTAVMYLVYRMFQYLRQLQNSFNRINEALPFIKNTVEYDRRSENAVEVEEGKQDFVFNKTIELKNIHVTLGVREDVLNDVSLSVKKNEMIGIMGPSGSGKTTLVDLLLRLYVPANGSIVVDGTDASEVSLASWRKSMFYVSQDIFLLNDTIAKNISFYNPDITEEQMTDALKQVGLLELLDGLPDGIHTNVGERGIKLSVGQRQRIVIARALVRNPKVLILDEVTSALDKESEQKIRDILQAMKGKITVFVIAHRLSTIEGVDRIVVLEDGAITKIGLPKDILKDA